MHRSKPGPDHPSTTIPSAERTDLPKSTVSRLTQTLVRLGLLHAEVDSPGLSACTGGAEPGPCDAHRLTGAVRRRGVDATACRAGADQRRAGRRRPGRNGLPRIDPLCAIEAAIEQVRRDGYCAASWQPEVVAVAAPLVASDGVYALNVSVLSTEAFDAIVTRLAPKLLGLRDAVARGLERLS